MRKKELEEALAKCEKVKADLKRRYHAEKNKAAKYRVDAEKARQDAAGAFSSLPLQERLLVIADEIEPTPQTPRAYVDIKRALGYLKQEVRNG